MLGTNAQLELELYSAVIKLPPVIDYIESTWRTVRATILPELLAETWKWICKRMFLYHRLKS